MTGVTAQVKTWNDAEKFDVDLKHDHGVVLKSQHDNLGVWATVRRNKMVSTFSLFWSLRSTLTLLKAVLVCNLLCIAAAADGYQITLNGLYTGTLVYLVTSSDIT